MAICFTVSSLVKLSFGKGLWVEKNVCRPQTEARLLIMRLVNIYSPIERENQAGSLSLCCQMWLFFALNPALSHSRCRAPPSCL